MQKLEIGTEVCAVIRSTIRNSYSYRFTKVAKLTAKRATLENGDVVVNETVMDWDKTGYIFNAYGNSAHNTYKIVTPEILADHTSMEHKKKIERWFDTQKFTFEQKEKIYNLLNELTP